MASMLTSVELNTIHSSTEAAADDSERERVSTNWSAHHLSMVVSETANGVDLAAYSASAAGDLDRKEAPDSNKSVDLASSATVVAVGDSLPTFLPHPNPNGFHLKDQQLHRVSSPGPAAASQRPQGSEQEMRDLEELLSKLNPMAAEFVPPSIAGGGLAAPYGGLGVGFGGGFYGGGFGATLALGNGGFDGGSGRRNKNGYGQGNRRMNSRTSLAQRDEVIRRTVYVADVDRQVTEEELAILFNRCGHVVDCRMCGDPKTILRFAFIEFEDDESARAALNLSGAMLGSYPLRVLPSKTAIAPVNPTFLPSSDDEREMCSRTVYCTNIDKKVSQAEIRLFFEFLCGEVYRLRLLGDQNHSTRIAFVEFVRGEPFQDSCAPSFFSPAPALNLCGLKKHSIAILQ
ncbi:polyadenylate-binding protein-interacting protein 12-like isoform X2 [Zingiber officinale]|uniref:polyadenylate-binding protein-interacting protein 12-like isoform X2 n=1 Tax=Zingiber officinale TaxID=94328 RepID=UPI001C4D75B3|nr:polyadenylate-binding protein-interacting protein 12-like isoform X2 [Zingiber officinale]